MMRLEIVSNRKLDIQIADQIRDRILAGDVEPGQQLPSERDLATTLGVSRPTVREALIALEVAGLVEVRVGVGAFVRNLEKSPTGLPEQSRSPMEIISVRRLLEPEAAALACRQIDAAGKGQLEAIIARMRSEARRGVWSTESDRALHMTIAGYTENAVLRDILDQLWSMRAEAVDSRFHQHLADIKQVREHILADHERIVTCIIEADAEGARSAMIEHLDYVSRTMIDSWE
jgi:GntR family transcriptional repressor for pyruvate dehydrogenase complex